MAKLPTYQSLKVTVAVSCVQSAISLDAETPAFFFSAWSKHVLTASHSILKHPQLGVDEEIKKTHPKHLHQATEKFYCYLLIYLTEAPSLLFFWLPDTVLMTTHLLSWKDCNNISHEHSAKPLSPLVFSFVLYLLNHPTELKSFTFKIKAIF